MVSPSKPVKGGHQPGMSTVIRTEKLCVRPKFSRAEVAECAMDAMVIEAME